MKKSMLIALVPLLAVLAGCTDLKKPVVVCLEWGVDKGVLENFGDVRKKCVRAALRCVEPLQLTEGRDGQPTCAVPEWLK